MTNKFKTGFLIAFVTLSSLEASFSQGTWTKKADFPSSSRFYGVGFSIGEKGYYGMGQKQVSLFSYKVYNDFWEYDPANNTWTQKSDFPGGGRIGAKGFAVHGKGYAGFGYFIMPDGPNAGSNDYQKDFYEFDPSANTWSKKNDQFLGGGDICFLIRDTLRVVNPEYRILKTYNFLTDTWFESTWDKKEIMPKYENIPENDAGFSAGGKEYIVTAVKKKGNIVNQLWEFDPRTLAWKERSSLPASGIDAYTTFSIDDKGYIMRDGNDLLEYDPAADTWTEKKDISLPEKRFAPAFTIGARSYGFSKYEFWEFAR